VLVDDLPERDRVAGAQRLNGCVFSNRHRAMVGVSRTR
jgi:hypothetical protein